MALHLVIGALLLVQAPQATMVGRVTDVETGAPLVDAVVRLTDLDRTAATDGDGRYELRAVAPGPQHLVVRSLGYGERTLHALVPRTGTLTIDVALAPVPLPLAPIQVRVTVPVRGAERHDSVYVLDRAVTIAAIRNHPLLAEPDALQALSGGEVVLQPESPSGVHVRGGAAEHTAYLIDGVPVLSPYHAAGLFGAWNPDALAAVRMAGAAPDPSHPETLSGAIEATTRAPGTALRADASVGSAQARVTADGPIGDSGAGWLVSARAGFPGIFAPKLEPSYVRGGTGDGLAKLEAPLLGGLMAVLGYASQNELDASAGADDTGPMRRHRFEWTSGSVGARWVRTGTTGVFEVRGWSAAAHAHTAVGA